MLFFEATLAPNNAHKSDLVNEVTKHTHHLPALRFFLSETTGTLSPLLIGLSKLRAWSVGAAVIDTYYVHIPMCIPVLLFCEVAPAPLMVYTRHREQKHTLII